jgi:hypothetical protein
MPDNAPDTAAQQPSQQAAGPQTPSQALPQAQALAAQPRPENPKTAVDVDILRLSENAPCTTLDGRKDGD